MDHATLRMSGGGQVVYPGQLVGYNDPLILLCDSGYGTNRSDAGSSLQQIHCRENQTLGDILPCVGKQAYHDNFVLIFRLNFKIVTIDVRKSEK